MPLLSSEAVVLRGTDYREADRIVTFLTPEHGRISGIAKGAKRIRSRFGSSLETLTHGRLVCFDRSGKGLVSIDHFDILESFQHNREDLVRSCSSQYLAELILHLIPEREAAAEVFSLLLSALRGIAVSPDIEAVLRIFEIRLLGLTGFAPRMDGCVQCGGPPDAATFSCREGGLVCGSCGPVPRDASALSPGCILFWRQALTMEEGRMDRIRLQERLNNELRDLLHLYFLHLLGREIRSFAFLRSLEGPGPERRRALGGG